MRRVNRRALRGTRLRVGDVILLSNFSNAYNERSNYEDYIFESTGGGWWQTGDAPSFMHSWHNDIYVLSGLEVTRLI